MNARNPFSSVKASGALLPVDLLSQVADASSAIPGIKPTDYHLDSGDRLSDAAARAWNVCFAAWSRFRQEFDHLPASDTGTTITRERFLLPLFRELGFGRLQSQKPFQLDEKTYAISHSWSGHVPIHLVSARVDLDRRQNDTTTKRSPYSLVQEFLNRSAQHRWGILSNGRKLYLLRDNISLTRASNVEFNLESIFENQSIADFKLLFNLCHQSRFEIPTDGNPEDCWLEKWSKLASERGTRAREKLRGGVEQAINALGTGFLETRGNAALKSALQSGQLDKQDYYRQLLRMVYRLLLLLVAENRTSETGQNLLHPLDTPDIVRSRYSRFYSVDRLRLLAQIRKGTTHTDLYESLKLLFVKLRTGYAPLGIPGLGSFLFSGQSTPDLDSAQLTNEALLGALRHLSFTTDDAPRGRGRAQGNRRPVDFANLGSEELGSVYESLLELHPSINSDQGTFHLQSASGNERKTSGSYYTPASLINCLLDSALEPVVSQALDKPSKAEAEKAVLSLKICDPACGSGHFLIAAAERLAKHLARLRTEDEEPSLMAIQHAKRDIIGQCIYGVDINPMSAELCKVSLWMEALEPGKPLGFLDHHIQVGNSLLGTTPELMEQGIPDEAFTKIEGDDGPVCTELKRRNKQERQGQRTFMFGDEPADSLHIAKVAREAFLIETMPADTADQVEQKAEKYRTLKEKGPLRLLVEVANAWCAAFVIPKVRSEPLQPRVEITHDLFRNLQENPHKTPAGMRLEIERLAHRYKFFHWHLAFPEVFNQQPSTNEHVKKGFDVILGNPPWERVKIQEKEWFAERSPEIANAPNAAARKRLIDSLKTKDPALHQAYLDDQRVAEGESQLMRNSGRYPLCGRGDVNTYTIFAELNRNLTGPTGRTGMIVPSGIATDDTTKFFFQDIVERRSLVSLFDFENRKGLFPEVDSRMKFSLLTLRAPVIDVARKVEPSEFVFFAHSTDELNDPNKRFTLTADDIALLNPNTRTCPIFRSKRDALLSRAIWWRVHPLRSGNKKFDSGWEAKYLRFVDYGGHANLLKPGVRSTSMNQIDLATEFPVWEAKLMHQFNHRFATYETETSLAGESRESTLKELQTPNYSIQSRFSIERSFFESLVCKPGYDHPWFLAYRDITNVTNERTVIASALPRTAASRSAPILGYDQSLNGPILLINLNCFSFDYCARQMMGGTHMTFSILCQLPVIPSQKYDDVFFNVGDISFKKNFMKHALELSYTSFDIKAFAHNYGWDGPPFRWDEERRFQIRCELDAAFFHLYLPADEQGRWKPARVAEGAVRDETPEELATLEKAFPTPRDAVAYIMETFPIVKRKDVAAYSCYRTKDRILEIYDQMQQAKVTGTPYQSPLNPPPGPPTDADGNFLSYSQINPADYPHIHPKNQQNAIESA